MKEDSWMDNPALGDIDPEKLKKLASLAGQAQGKNQKELFPFLMNAMSQAGSGGLSFDLAETEAIIRVLKAGKSPQEIRKIDRICAIMRKRKPG